MQSTILQQILFVLDALWVLPSGCHRFCSVWNEQTWEQTVDLFQISWSHACAHEKFRIFGVFRIVWFFNTGLINGCMSKRMSKLENQPCIAVIQIFLLKYCTSDPAANAPCRGHHQLSVCENRLKSCRCALWGSYWTLVQNLFLELSHTSYL